MPMFHSFVYKFMNPNISYWLYSTEFCAPIGYCLLRVSNPVYYSLFILKISKAKCRMRLSYGALSSLSFLTFFPFFFFSFSFVFCSWVVFVCWLVVVFVSKSWHHVLKRNYTESCEISLTISCLLLSFKNSIFNSPMHRLPQKLCVY